MIDKVRSRLASWKKSFFSKAGRLTLIKFVLSIIPVYFLSPFKAPGEVCKLVERLMRGFLWDGMDEGKEKGLTLLDGRL